MPKEDRGEKIIESIAGQISKNKDVAYFCLNNSPIKTALEIGKRLDGLITKLKSHEDELILYNHLLVSHNEGLEINSYLGHGGRQLNQFCSVISGPFYKIYGESCNLTIVTRGPVAYSSEYDNKWKKRKSEREFDISFEELEKILSRQEDEVRHEEIKSIIKDPVKAEEYIKAAKMLEKLFKGSELYIGDKEVKAELDSKKYKSLVETLGY